MTSLTGLTAMTSLTGLYVIVETGNNIALLNDTLPSWMPHGSSCYFRLLIPDSIPRRSVPYHDYGREYVACFGIYGRLMEYRVVDSMRGSFAAFDMLKPGTVVALYNTPASIDGSHIRKILRQHEKSLECGAVSK